MFAFIKKLFNGNRGLHIDLETLRDIAPEDILPDFGFEKSSGEAPMLQGDEYNQKKLEIPVRAKSVRLTFFLFFALIAGILGYTLFLFVARGDEYSSIAANNAMQIYEIGPSRGDIISADGVVIASSTVVFDLVVAPSKLTTQEAENLAADISKLFNDTSQDELFQQIRAAQSRNLGEQILIKSISQDDAGGLTSVLDKYDFLQLQQRSVRSYPYNSLYAHIIGYTALVSAEDLENFSDYDLNDQIGKKGIEFYFEDDLKGRDGLFAKIISSQGAITGERLVREIERGSDIQLTINHDLQLKSREALLNALEEYQIKSGAVVALNPKNGDILAFVSLPDFDPNDFTRGLSQKDFQSYFENSVQPLFNRVTQGEYASGSVIKLIIATAALEENVISPNQYILTHGYIDVPSVYDPNVTYRFYDWKDHGAVNMREAIAVSSNVYFYTIGGGFDGQEGLGIERISDYLKRFNWGRTFGLDFGTESAGLVPTPQWKQAVKNENWTIGDTYNVSIGQGDILATPLQVASATAVFANGGTLWRPDVIASVGGKDAGPLQAISRNLLSDDSLGVVRSGMREAVLSGSSRYLSTLPSAVAGKTGTVQASGGDNHAWFTGFAPYENPEIVVTVLLERGRDSTNAVRVAHEILNWYLAK